MKLIGNHISSAFSKISKSKKQSNYYGSLISSSDDESITPKSVLRRGGDFWSPASSHSIAADLFNLFHRDASRKITKTDLEAVLRRLDPNNPATEVALASMLDDIDRDGDGYIGLDDLVAIIPAAPIGRPLAGENLREAFDVFDADGDGKISAEELLGMFTALGDGGCTISDCRRMIRGVDSDGDGTMKLIGNRISSAFSRISKSKKQSNYYGSLISSSSEDESFTPKSVLRRGGDFWSPASSHSIAADLFNLFHRDASRKITKTDLEAVLRRLDPNNPAIEVALASMLDDIDRDGDGYIGLDELEAIIPAAPIGRPLAGENLREAFDVFDADGDGKISAEELLGMFTALGDGGCTISDCRRMIRGVDSDGDGFVCFGDFARMMDGSR
ncbi:putative calcium-binding protein CML36 [Platanthera guangdongensis]|uniref:Calcium-binding protein CML36 n=1 Tax=Platanthera guangdongensis TaxID=2320717 RepID=A0ABR2M680_9ASPA